MVLLRVSIFVRLKVLVDEAELMIYMIGITVVLLRV